MKILSAVLILLLNICAGTASAAKHNSLDMFYNQVKTAYLTFDCAYVLTPAEGTGLIGSTRITGTAAVQMQGESYIFNGNGLVIRSDGQSLCIMDESIKEVIYEPLPSSLSEADYLQNPAYLIIGLEDNFTVLESRTAGTSVDSYILVPSVDCGIVRCVLEFSATDNLLSKASFELSDGSALEVDIDKMKVLPKKSSSHFSQQDPSSFDSSWVVTDLR